MKFPGKRPTKHSVAAGKLAPCPNKPNCVSSQAADKKHHVQPLRSNGNPGAAMQKLKAIVQAMPRATIVESRSDYLYAEFATKMMGFVDDVEFYCDGHAIHVRSASRLGYSDWGVNRKRVEEIRRRFTGD